jgi:hypothetical protein
MWEWSPCRSGKGGPMQGSNSMKAGGEADIMTVPNLLVSFNKALICGYFPWYLVARPI